MIKGNLIIKKKIKILPLDASHQRREMKKEKAIINGLLCYVHGLPKEVFNNGSR